MSRFWGGDESESESESEESQEEGDKIHLTSRFAQKYDSEEEEEVKRVVRSHKDKHLDALGDIVQLIQESIKEDNYAILGNNFTKLNDALVKWKKVVGAEGGIAPKVYYQGLLLIDEKISNLSKEEKAKMDKNNARALTTLAQKFKKNLGPFQKEFEEYKKNPSGDDDEKESDVDEEKSEDDASDEEESLGRLVSSSSSSSSKKTQVEDSEDEDAVEEAPKPAPKQGANKWLKTSEESEEEKAEEEAAQAEGGKKKRTRKRNKNTVVKEEPPKPVKIEWTLERVDEELKDIISGKLGKKKIDKPTQIIKLTELMANAQSVAQQLTIRMHLVSCHFDTTISMKQHMSRENWLSVYEEVSSILRLLDQNKDVELAESLPNSDTSPEDPQAARLVAFLQRLTDEIFKAYRSTDPNSVDYLERLGDEELVLELARQMHRYYNRINHKLEISQVALLRMKFLHYRRDDLPQIPSPLLKISSSDAQETPNESRSTLLDKLTTIVCSYGNERMKSHAILYLIYHHALEKRFFEARDLLLMSHLQDQVQHADVNTQILYHRATVQLGLCAFRLGRIVDAHNCFSDLYQTNRVRELLAQGTTARYGDRNTDQEKIEKQRQMPYHMHLNLELLECVHLISAMLLETPNMAAQGYDSKRKVISRPFRRYMDIFDRQIFGGVPPESPRDHVIAAARALRDANVPQAIAFITNLSCWKILPDCEEVKEMLQKNIREVALQTFVLKYSRAFSSVSIDYLSNISGLSPKAVHSILSRMMINEEIKSCWHQPTKTMVMHHADPNKMQSLVLQYADKVETFVGENERVFESRTGGFGYDKRSGREGEEDDRRKPSWSNRDNRRPEGSSSSGSNAAPGRKYRNYTGGGGYSGGSRGGNSGSQSEGFRSNWEGNRGKPNY